MPRLSPFILMGVAVLGCSPEPQDGAQSQGPEAEFSQAEVLVEPTTVTLACEGGVGVRVAYSGQGQARLTWGNQTFNLTREPAAQGVRYVGDGVEWSSQNRDGQEYSRLRRLNAQGQGEAGALAQCQRAAAQLAQRPRSPDQTPCISPDLAYAIETGDAAMGHRQTTIGVQNIGPKPCALMGYPIVRLSGKPEANAALAKIRVATRTHGYMGPVKAALPIVLKPKEQAYFDLRWSVMPLEVQGETRCPEASQVVIAPPGDIGGKPLPLVVSPCGGKIEVSPLRSEAAHLSLKAPVS